ncbi:MAG: NifB/NifX family molybdenum-iron cluster-binding protein [Arcobacteraceae bacterium]|jgi:predicted Fe-Mo cluster-binding NifX family protein|nr:NifB/NifX family molybdenum-iron cluster-binding protein [Arcobacteraceae bacterium]
MIAIPIKMEKESSAVSPLFGKAKYFAIADKGKIEILKNVCQGGNQVAIWLHSLGVKKLLISHMGTNPFEKLTKFGIESYFVGEERILLKEALLAYADGDLMRVDKENFDTIFPPHSHGENHHHHHKGNDTADTFLIRGIDNPPLMNNYHFTK